MINEELSLMIANIERENPEQQMWMLGQLLVQVNAIRLDCTLKGLEAIENQYYELKKVIVKKQEELLAAHPKLVRIVLPKQ